MSESVAIAEGGAGEVAGWQRRVVDRSLDDAKRRSIDRGARLIRAAAKVLDRTNGESLTVQEVADEAGQSLRTLYQYFSSKDDLLLAVYEEAMRTYARLITAAVKPLEDPLERLAGGIIASARMPAMHGSGRDRGLTHLRLQLSQARPALVASAQEPVTVFFGALIREAAEAGQLAGVDIEQATYFICSLRNSYTTSVTLGNDLGLELPDVVDLSLFSLGGLGAVLPREWHQKVDDDLHLTGGDGRSILRQLTKEPSSRAPRAKAR
ncbi:MAG TPA: TetR/AcrR family transcriptional regulator [Frankiaceae bacterium]|jgi:AcrR family transcriptional regulator|nr:TetR/AcrR family transcriptional regulator [Frankiaceae bacterium]